MSTRPRLDARARAEFEERGYVVIPSALSRAQCERTIDELWEQIERSSDVRRARPQTWGPLNKQGFVDIFSSPAMWVNRQSEAIYEALADLYGTRALWMIVDRAGLKRPGVLLDAHGRPRSMAARWQRKADIHTDLNLWHPPGALNLQGLVALTDTSADQGGFGCIPGFHHRYRDWAARNLAARRPPEQVFVRFPDRALIERELVTVEMRAGDYLVWNALLPHGNTPNRTSRWRCCQYICHVPVRDEFFTRHRQTVESWRSGTPPATLAGGKRRRPQTSSREAELHTPAPLSALGRRLLGLSPWS